MLCADERGELIGRMKGLQDRFEQFVDIHTANSNGAGILHMASDSTVYAPLTQSHRFFTKRVVRRCSLPHDELARIAGPGRLQMIGEHEMHQIACLLMTDRMSQILLRENDAKVSLHHDEFHHGYRMDVSLRVIEVPEKLSEMVFDMEQFEPI